MSPEARVGLVTVLAFLLVLGFAVFLPSVGVLRPPGYALTVVLRDAAGVEAGTPVRMAGVTMGRVSAVALSPANKALVTITVDAAARIPQGSRFQAATPGLVGERFVAIIPGPADASPIAPGSVVEGEEPFSFDRLTARVEEVADQVGTLVQNVNTLVADPQMRADLRQALRSAREATAIAKQALEEARATSASARRAAVNVERTARRIRQLVDTDVLMMVEDLRRASASLAEASAGIRAFVEDTTAEGVLSEDIRKTATSIRDASERVRQMMEDLQGLINSENVAGARETVHEAQAAVKDARAVIQRAGALLQQVDGFIPGGLTSPDRRRLLALTYDVWYAGQRAGHNLEVTLFPGSARSYRLGLYDIGNTNGLMLQVGGRLSSMLGWRAGVYASQVGLGLDYSLGGPLSLSLDAYNLNLPTVDALVRYRISPTWSITLGGRSVFRTPSFVMGIGTSF